MDQPLSILHVQHSLHPGGMENGVINVARSLQPRGFRFHVACLSTSGEFAARLPEPNLVYPLNKPERFSWQTVRSLNTLIHQVDPDVIHSHNLGALLYTACASRFGRLRPILHGEHGTPNDGPDAQRRHLQRKLFFRAARKVHTVSHSLHEHFLKAGFPASKLIPLVNGVDTDRYRPGDAREARKQLGLPENSPVLLIVGRLISSKGHIFLFQALEQISRSFPDVSLLVLGDGGADRDEIQRAASGAAAADLIRMEGYQSDLLPYYQAADLLVAPSNVEGLSNAMLEAMACGLPALLADACGNREVVKDGVDGILRNLESSAQLASCIIEALQNRDKLRRYGEQARERVVSDYSLDAMAKAYEETYRQMATQPR